ncbi:PREDICTED: flocculation protein FLO11-like [Nicotiana attenuata]|uniref:flocculation protein FLO11-like n=1 Tax=Nicotiana attenuata TaxID=49451 RepID=UPI00090518CD|nr:PREDICTED: flocculation protein FLO11-like [Nicotiana attenuata]
MASKGKGKMKSKKKKQLVPTSSTMPNMSHPLPHPPQSTSLPSTIFTIPPPSNNSVQYYSMPAKGSQSNTVFNFVPTPSIPLSSPGFHGSQHGGSPVVAPSVFYGCQHTDSPAAAPPGFHDSQHIGSPAAAPPSFHGSQHTGSPAAAPPSFHGSQHDGASFVAPSSSNPSSSSIHSISRLDIGGSRPATSGAASAPSRRRRQNLGGDVQFDSYNRLIIVPHKNGFLPSFQATHMVTDSMKPFYHEPWTSWKKIPYSIREQMWNQFRTRCTWNPQHQNAINSIFEKKVGIRIKDTMCASRNSGKMPDWLRKDVWDKLLEK